MWVVQVAIDDLLRQRQWSVQALSDDVEAVRSTRSQQTAPRQPSATHLSCIFLYGMKASLSSKLERKAMRISEAQSEQCMAGSTPHRDLAVMDISSMSSVGCSSCASDGGSDSGAARARQISRQHGGECDVQRRLEVCATLLECVSDEEQVRYRCFVREYPAAKEIQPNRKKDVSKCRGSCITVILSRVEQHQASAISCLLPCRDRLAEIGWLSALSSTNKWMSELTSVLSLHHYRVLYISHTTQQ